MRKVVYSFIFIFFVQSSAFALKLESERVKKSIDRLATKKAIFFSEYRGESYYLGGSWMKKFPAKGFSASQVVQLKKKTRAKKVYPQLLKLKKRGHDLFVKRGKKIVTLYKRKKKTFKMAELPTSKRDARKVLRKTVCSLCQVKVAANFLTVDGVKQVNPEITWVPFYMFNERFGLSFPISWSIYSTENDNLEEEYTFVGKAQVLLRTYFNRFYVELGGGVNQFFSFSDTSNVLTLGSGYIFKKKRWIISDDFSFTGLHFYYSQVDWIKPITELKVGVNFSF